MVLPTYSFVLIAVMLAIVVGRLGTIIREQLDNK